MRLYKFKKKTTFSMSESCSRSTACSSLVWWDSISKPELLRSASRSSAVTGMLLLPEIPFASALLNFQSSFIRSSKSDETSTAGRAWDLSAPQMAVQLSSPNGGGPSGTVYGCDRMLLSSRRSRWKCFTTDQFFSIAEDLELSSSIVPSASSPPLCLLSMLTSIRAASCCSQLASISQTIRLASDPTSRPMPSPFCSSASVSSAVAILQFINCRSMRCTLARSGAPRASSSIRALKYLPCLSRKWLRRPRWTSVSCDAADASIAALFSAARLSTFHHSGEGATSKAA
mmetsp:Transcript_9341/g.34968  ORF Transcript_9341/g.34968 Transcript_9341/m.34968 type:complete len:287 (+) Transcript_9341:884-1744(+)